MTDYTLRHDLLLGEPDIKRINFNIWASNETAIIQLAKEFNIYDKLIKPNTTIVSNTFIILKCKINEYVTISSILIFAYFYDYPNPIDNGFVLYKINDASTLFEDKELLNSLKHIGLDLYSENIISQIRNQID